MLGKAIRTTYSGHVRCVQAVFRLALASLFIAASVHGPVEAQTACAPRAEMLEGLSKQYAEVPVAMGLSSNGGVVELFRNAKGATWTIIINLPNGLSCLMSAGEGWEMLPQVVAGRAS